MHHLILAIKETMMDFLVSKDSVLRLKLLQQLRSLLTPYFRALIDLEKVRQAKGKKNCKNKKESKPI